jgi:hypothetical protein
MAGPNKTYIEPPSPEKWVSQRNLVLPDRRGIHGLRLGNSRRLCCAHSLLQVASHFPNHPQLLLFVGFSPIFDLGTPPRLPKQLPKGQMFSTLGMQSLATSPPVAQLKTHPTHPSPCGKIAPY